MALAKLTTAKRRPARKLTPLRHLPAPLNCLLYLSIITPAQANTSGWDCQQEVINGSQQWRCSAAEVQTPQATVNSAAQAADAEPVQAESVQTVPAQKLTPAKPAPAVSEPSHPLTADPHQNDPHQNIESISHINLAKQDWQPLPRNIRAIEDQQLADYAQQHFHCGGYYLNPVAPAATGADAGANVIANNIEQSALPIEASAASTSMQDGVAIFEQDVLVTQGDTSLRADKATYNDATGQVELLGNVVVRNPGAAFGGQAATINLQQRSSQISDANYVVHQQHIRGSAKSISASADSKITITDGSYTQCSPDSNLWAVTASEIRLDQQRGQGSARNAKVEVGGVPVVYLPYARFPIGDKRQSGFLFPSLSDSSSGIDLTVPYYFNIAPNADATLAPRYNADRGYITEAEARWLNRFDQWTISGAYIDNDRDFTDPNPASQDTRRWVVDIKERGQIGKRLFSSVDYTRVSDNDYLRDLNTTSLSVNRTTHLNQRAALNYLGDRFSAGVQVQQYQTIDNNVMATQPFETTPEVWLAYQSLPVPQRVGVDTMLRYSAFEHDQLNAGDRGYGEFNLTYPLNWQGLRIEPKVGIAHIEYRLDDNAALAGGDDNPSTSAPQAQLKLDMVFEKHSDHRRSTLEPGIFYLYRDADPQTDLPLFDTQILTVNSQQLTRSSPFSGYDRLEDTNQVAAYITHRLFSPGGDEYLAATLGQISYFDDESAHSPALQRRDIGQKSSAIIGDIDARLGRGWRSSGTILWDPNDNQLDEGSIAFRYRGKYNGKDNPSSIINIGYHYRLADKRLRLLQKDIEQADLSFVRPLSKRWALIGRFQYDTTADRSNETLGGIEYNDCCIKWRVIYRDGLVYNGSLNSATNTERDRSVFLQVELKGLFGIGNAVETILDEAIRGYSTSFIDDSEHTSF